MDAARPEPYQGEMLDENRGSFNDSQSGSDPFRGKRADLTNGPGQERLFLLGIGVAFGDVLGWTLWVDGEI